MNSNISVTQSGQTQHQVEFNDNGLTNQLLGQHNIHLTRITQALDIVASVRGNTVFLRGDDPLALNLAETILNQLYSLLAAGFPLLENDVEHAIRILSANDQTQLKDIFLDKIYISVNKQAITPKGTNQKKYIDAMRNHDIVFGIGPAGTGKTYLAMATAVANLTKGAVKRIILTRPAVEAGENLGFLPGDLADKIDPYLRPLYDALHDMMPFEKVSALLSKGVIEVAPLAFMRGRTLNDAFVILDEAQNTTSEQMKMFLTRLGFGSQAVVTGDITQTDLPTGKRSGLVEAKDILDQIPGIKLIFFSQHDVVRHQLVQKIVEAYETAEKSSAKLES